MKSAVHASRVLAALFFLLLLFAVPATLAAQDTAADDSTRAQLIEAARDIMQSAHFCDLITLDETRRPRSRVMDPFPPDDDMVVWFGTNRSTRKVAQIQRDPRVTLEYFAPEYYAYVTISGMAELVDDPAEKEHRWKDEWTAFYPDRGTYLLIKVTPEWLELVSAKHGIQSDPETWQPPVVEF